MPEQFSYLDLPAFLQFSAFNHFQGMVHINESECHSNRPTCITSFIFTTGFTNRVRYTEMLPLITEWREINEHFSNLNVSSYNERADFADQAIAMLKNPHTHRHWLSDIDHRHFLLADACRGFVSVRCFSLFRSFLALHSGSPMLCCVCERGCCRIHLPMGH